MERCPFRFGVVSAPTRSGEQWLATARRAEALGYDALLIPDTLAPLPALAAAAAATRTLRVGTYVLANDFRNPVLVARESATIDFISGGRFELGLGAGHPGIEADCRMLGQPFAPAAARVARLAEAIRIIKALLAGDTAQAIGPHYPIADAKVSPAPVQQPRPPLLVAAAGDRMLALAAREADIVALALPPNSGADAFAARITLLRQAAPERFPQLELNLNLMAVGDEVPPWIAQNMGLDAAALRRSGSPAVLMGAPDEMASQLLAQREALGVSYITLADGFMEAFAPVVERLAGR
jgi:probable F420-dependent oxidoreductase